MIGFDEFKDEWLLKIARRNARIWFWKPQWHWFGWKTLIPFSYGHDEYARRVLVFGWTVTGRVLIPVWDCGDPDCKEDAIQSLKEDLVVGAVS